VTGALPEVLVPGGRLSSISTRRALKQALSLLEAYWMLLGEDDDAEQDRLLASMDDLEVMLLCVGRADA